MISSVTLAGFETPKLNESHKEWPQNILRKNKNAKSRPGAVCPKFKMTTCYFIWNHPRYEILEAPSKAGNKVDLFVS